MLVAVNLSAGNRDRVHRKKPGTCLPRSIFPVETQVDAFQLKDFAGIYLTDEAADKLQRSGAPPEWARSIREVSAQQYTEKGSYSVDLTEWKETDSAGIETVETGVVMPVVKDTIHSIFKAKGDRIKVRYGLDGGPIRYFRLCRVSR